MSLRIVQSADHILNAYDAGISDYTERKFARDGIDVMTNLRVLSVEPGEVRARHKVLGKEVVLPYSLCVWSTGIGPKPLIISLANKLEGQRNTRALTTDEV